MEGYNGWTNYETWNVALWIDNDQGSYNYWREQAKETYSDGWGKNTKGRREYAVRALAVLLKDWMDENCPITKASVYCDLLGAALSEVNYDEIAANWIDEVAAEVEQEESVS